MSVGTALAAACTLGGMGYACFPCREDKRPATPNGFKAAVTVREAIEDIWRRYPGELVGVATGSMSGIAVLDVDAKHNTARQWWIENRARLLPARVHRTRSGGFHIIYKHRAGLACTVSRIASGVDVRADNGYAVWWPAAGFPVLEDAGIKPWPQWLDAALAPTPTPSLPISCRAIAVRDHDLRPTLHRATGIVRRLAQAPEGERNQVLFWATCRVRDMYKGNELDHASAMQMVELLREAAGRCGLSQRETERTITSALRARAA
jgi:hypothetical protein